MDMEQPIAGRAVSLFCRGFGVIIVMFAASTVPPYLSILEKTVLVFPYYPWHHLPLPVLEPAQMEHLRKVLIACGAGVTCGLAPRCCLLAAGCIIAYFVQLDRSKHRLRRALIACGVPSSRHPVIITLQRCHPCVRGHDGVDEISCRLDDLPLRSILQQSFRPPHRALCPPGCPRS